MTVSTHSAIHLLTPVCRLRTLPEGLSFCADLFCVGPRLAVLALAMVPFKRRQTDAKRADPNRMQDGRPSSCFFSKVEHCFPSGGAATVIQAGLPILFAATAELTSLLRVPTAYAMASRRFAAGERFSTFDNFGPTLARTAHTTLGPFGRH
jgi:hypothetical protein